MDLKHLRETDENVVILPGAKVNGDVTFGPDCSVWYNAVLRGDACPIRIGEGSNIQDNAVLHSGKSATILGKGVTVGHGAIVHGCSVGDNTLVGMGAILLDGALIGKNCLIAAGSLVAPRTVIPDGSLVMGSPARVKRPLTEAEIEKNREDCRHYMELKELYR